MEDMALGIADFLARHLVTIVGMHSLYRPDGVYRGLETTNGSAFLMRYRKLPILITAGHIVTELNRRLDAPDSKNWIALIDSVHQGAVHKNSLWLPWENLYRE